MKNQAVLIVAFGAGLIRAAFNTCQDQSDDIIMIVLKVVQTTKPKYILIVCAYRKANGNACRN
ncbi:MAG: hypothetical protein GYA39_07630 [Methanothrix sp.]|nr:hypothetical protein [Methanothrix sp.]